MANSYKMTNGQRIAKITIDKNVRLAKQRKLKLFFDEHGFYFCEDCGRSSGDRFDLSHIISVDKCQKNGESELAWSVSNLRILCRKCHKIFDKLN